MSDHASPAHYSSSITLHNSHPPFILQEREFAAQEAAAPEDVVSSVQSEASSVSTEADPITMADEVREGATKEQEDRKAKEATAEAAAEGEKEEGAEVAVEEAEEEEEEEEEVEVEEVEVEEEEVFVRDRTIERVKSKLDAMLEKLEADVAKVTTTSP